MTTPIIRTDPLKKGRLLVKGETTTATAEPSAEALEVYGRHLRLWVGKAMTDEINAVPEDAGLLRESIRQERQGEVRWEDDDDTGSGTQT